METLVKVKIYCELWGGREVGSRFWSEYPNKHLNLYRRLWNTG